MIVARAIVHSNLLISHQLIPGHEAIGRVVEKGKNVKDFEVGDRVVADVGTSVSIFLHCVRDTFICSR